MSGGRGIGGRFGGKDGGRFGGRFGGRDGGGRGGRFGGRDGGRGAGNAQVDESFLEPCVNALPELRQEELKKPYLANLTYHKESRESVYAVQSDKKGGSPPLRDPQRTVVQSFSRSVVQSFSRSPHVPPQ
eukprot:6607284-Pyramimonas_sp.AAC.1